MMHSLSLFKALRRRPSGVACSSLPASSFPLALRFFSTSSGTKGPEDGQPRTARLSEGPGPKVEILLDGSTPAAPPRSELYGFKLYESHGPRDHINPDGTMNFYDPSMINKNPVNLEIPKWNRILDNAPPQKFINVNGQAFITGVHPKPPQDIHWVAQRNEPYVYGGVNTHVSGRKRQATYANYDLIMKIDYAVFWVPAFIIFAITIPTYCLTYMMDEVTYTTMTVKVIGRQWYWVYEIESPTDDAAEDEDDEDGE